MVCQSVDFFMGLQIACLRECLVTLWTAEWFVNSVDFFMGLQIACLREYLATLWTAEWFVSSVDFFMDLQIVCLRECLMPHFGQLIGTSTMWIFS